MKAGLQMMNKVTKLTLLCGLILMAGMSSSSLLAADEHEGDTAKTDRTEITKKIDEKVQPYTELITKIDKWDDKAIFSFEDGRFFTGKQLKGTLLKSLNGLVEYRRLVQEFCWNEEEHTHIMEISKKLDEIVTSLNGKPEAAKVKVSDLKEAKFKAIPKDAEGEEVAADTEVDVKKIKADLSVLSELSLAVKQSFDRENESGNVFKKVAAWEGTGLNESTVSTVKRAQDKDDTKFAKDMATFAKLLGHTPKKDDKITDALKPAMDAIADAEKDACVFVATPKAEVKEDPKKGAKDDKTPAKDDDKTPAKDDKTPAKDDKTPKATNTPGSGSPLGLAGLGGAQPGVNPFIPQIPGDQTAAQKAIDDAAAQIAAAAAQERFEDDRDDDRIDDLERLFADQLAALDDQNDDINDQLAIPQVQNGKNGKAGNAAQAQQAPPAALPLASAQPTPQQGGNEPPPFDPNQGIPPFQPPPFQQPPQLSNNDNDDDDLKFAAQQYKANEFKLGQDEVLMAQREQALIQGNSQALAAAEFNRVMMQNRFGMQPQYGQYGAYPGAPQFPGQTQLPAGQNWLSARIPQLQQSGAFQPRTTGPVSTPTLRLGQSNDTSAMASTYGGRTSAPSAVSGRSVAPVRR